MREDREPRDPIEVGDELSHPGSGVANRAPLAGRVRDLDRSREERLVLGPLEIGVAAMA
jgi:hypothetical protein